jgi:glycosyltransferase involved in cell wall biosynthesis
MSWRLWWPCSSSSLPSPDPLMASDRAPLVSILIPAFNAERWVADTIRSASMQSWPRIEIIVVDDGSTDNTFEVARALANRSILVTRQPNLGAPAARNKALSLAQGEYIQWLDADDLLDRNKISVQMDVALAISDPNYVLSGPFGTFFYRPERALFTKTALWRDLTPVEYFLTRFGENACFQTDAWLVSRQLTEMAGPWTDFDSPDDDGEYFSRIVMKSAGVRFVPGAKSYYRIGNFGSLNNARSPRALHALYRSKLKCINYLLALEDTPRTRQASIQLLQRWLEYFHPNQPEIVSEAAAVAVALGGKLYPPRLKWKYQPIEWICGYDAALKASRVLPRIRVNALRKCDELAYRLKSHRSRTVR